MGRRPPSIFSIWLLPLFYFQGFLTCPFLPLPRGPVVDIRCRGPPTLPRLTDPLHSGIPNRIQSTGRRLGGLPGHAYFTKIAAKFPYEDVEWTMDLASRSSDTLGSLNIPHHHSSTLLLPPPDPRVRPIPHCYLRTQRHLFRFRSASLKPRSSRTSCFSVGPQGFNGSLWPSSEDNTRNNKISTICWYNFGLYIQFI